MSRLRRTGLLLLFIATGCSARLGFSPDPSPGPSPGPTSSSTVTYAYVSSTTSSGTFQISGYAVGSDGTLKQITGSPFVTSGYSPLALSGTGAMLFGADGYSIDSFTVASDGSLKQVSSFAAGNLSKGSPPTPVGGPIDLFFDHSSSVLYDGFANLNGTGNNGYQALSFDSKTGQVALIGNAGSSPGLDGVLAFTSGNQFAYTTSCYRGIPAITGFERGGNGTLTPLSESGPAPMPAAPSGQGYCPQGAAADSSNHLIIVVGITPSGGMPPTGPWQLAIYTVNSSGSVSTASTSSNMPTTNVGQPQSYLLSSDGKYLAVGGSSGLQVFAYSSTSGTITALGGGTVLTSAGISQIAWDAGDHLYALSRQSNSLSLYSVSASGATAVSGSPYSIDKPYGLAILTQTSGGGS
jgi:hypothetical protein